MLSRTVWIILLPVIMIGGAFLASSGLPLGLDDAYDDFLLPFLITTWIGLGAANAWDVVRRETNLDRLSPGTLTAIGLTCALIFFAMLGPETLWEEPWLFGIFVWPGIELALPWLRSKPAPPPGAP